jgi:hypothetical protein
MHNLINIMMHAMFPKTAPLAPLWMLPKLVAPPPLQIPTVLVTRNSILSQILAFNALTVSPVTMSTRDAKPHQQQVPATTWTKSKVPRQIATDAIHAKLGNKLTELTTVAFSKCRL